MNKQQAGMLVHRLFRLVWQEVRFHNNPTRDNMVRAEGILDNLEETLLDVLSLLEKTAREAFSEGYKARLTDGVPDGN